MTGPISAYVRDMGRRGLSPVTVDKRTRCLHLYAGECGLEASREQVEDWLDGRHLSPKSRAVWISHLHAFYTFAVAEGLLKADPTARIKPPRLRRALPRPMPEASLRRALERATPIYRCWLLLGALEGLRCQEIAGLAKEDVLAPEGLLRVVHGKGGKERYVPLHPDVLAALERYGMPEEGPLFTKREGGALSAGDVSHRLGDYLHGMGIASSPHSLRHRFATEVYRGSLDIRMTQELLGHQSVATTSIYAKADMRGAAAVVSALKVA